MIIEEVKLLLKKYNKTKDEKIYKELSSYVIKTETLLTSLVFNREFRPNDNDEYQGMRDLLKEIRKDLNLFSYNSYQHTQDDIEEFRRSLEKISEDCR